MELDSKKAVMMPEGVYVIGTYDEDGNPDAMNAAWGVQSGYGQISLFVSGHKTTENLKKTGAFTVAFGTRKTVVISDYFGMESARNVPDKLKKAGVHVHKAPHVNAPVIEEYPVTMECEVVSYDEGSMHLVGRVVDEIVDDSVVTDGAVDLGKLEPIVYDPSTHVYRVIGEVVGRAFHEGAALR
jgi:flavin reductase (DIM6/NTAB) family NADH-FMN oxidoreductase RutF